MAITTLSELFLKAAGFNKPDCLLYKVGGTYQPVSTAELVDRVRRLAKALAGLGVQRGDRVALMAENGPHWPAVDFATLCSGAVLVPIYPTLLPEQAAYIANDCGAKVVFAQTAEHLQGFLSQRREAAAGPALSSSSRARRRPAIARVTTLADLLVRDGEVDPAAFEQKARSVQPDDLATLVYTSGTTGNPKGVMLTHGNITSNVVAAWRSCRSTAATPRCRSCRSRTLRADGRLPLLLPGRARSPTPSRSTGGAEPPGGQAARLRRGAARLREGAARGSRRTWPRRRRHARRSSTGRWRSAARPCPGVSNRQSPPGSSA